MVKQTFEKKTFQRFTRKSRKSRKSNTSKSVCTIASEELLPYIEDERLFRNQYGRVSSTCQYCFPNHPTAPSVCPSECLYPSDRIMSFMDSVYTNKVPTRKVFIVGYGPPASGKSNIITSLNHPALPQLKDLHVTHNNTIEMDVDKVFQGKHSPLYFGKLKKRVENDTQLKIPPNVRNARLYSTYRHIADQLNDAVYWKSLALGYNIYFETTGWSVEWLNTFIHNSHRAGYTCVVCYPYVSTPELVKRIKARETTQIGRSVDEIQESVSRAQENLQNIALDTEFGDRLVVFDNRTTVANGKQNKTPPIPYQMPILYCGNVNDKSLQSFLEKLQGKKV